MHYLPGPTAAVIVHQAKVDRRGPVTSGCRAPVPARRRGVVRRRNANPLVEVDPEVGAYTRSLLSST